MKNFFCFTFTLFFSFNIYANKNDEWQKLPDGNEVRYPKVYEYFERRRGCYLEYYNSKINRYILDKEFMDIWVKNFYQLDECKKYLTKFQLAALNYGLDGDLEKWLKARNEEKQRLKKQCIGIIGEEFRQKGKTKEEISSKCDEYVVWMEDRIFPINFPAKDSQNEFVKGKFYDSNGKEIDFFAK